MSFSQIVFVLLKYNKKLTSHFLQITIYTIVHVFISVRIASIPFIFFNLFLSLFFDFTFALITGTPVLLKDILP